MKYFAQSFTDNNTTYYVIKFSTCYQCFLLFGFFFFFIFIFNLFSIGTWVYHVFRGLQIRLTSAINQYCYNWQLFISHESHAWLESRVDAYHMLKNGD